MAEALASLKEGLRVGRSALRQLETAAFTAPPAKPSQWPPIIDPYPPATEIEIDITLDAARSNAGRRPRPRHRDGSDGMIDVSLEEAFFNDAGRVESTEASTEATPALSPSSVRPIRFAFVS
jgi:hypothetical protein